MLQTKRSGRHCASSLTVDPKKKDPQMQLVDGIANIPRLGDKEYLQCGVLMVTTDPGFM